MPHQTILSPVARSAAAASAAAEATATIATPTGFRLTAHNQYNATRLDAAHLPRDPFPLFRLWLHEALRPTHGQTAVREPEAMTLSTVSSSGIPSSRVVLLKEIDDHGFLFFTNYESRKASELETGHAALSFYWREVSRQIRVVGIVEKVSPEESQAYFATRPRGSQIGAWASPQSRKVGEGEMERRVKEVGDKFADEVPCPPHWGGYRVVPVEIEFWAGRPSRIHDRFVYTRPDASSPWTVERRAP
ncbi:hypothetical protein CcaverHIS002_0112940 [Cutaneotrichosporon cavernicola]|uniref:pyridoxal 5'-phosphate synthase n=1 Tax=Cutaneotrichosporon cavernicola TaxID=279322 RepID=A0AA48I9B0_9TREE|nr:uncharacterized protein CcaverHIS019_0112800 [Cutaneotrichosporon cavernicola]BEI80765.1 hypothetical protein CcaverHIS002_0112940 [Cutaneotrichosporon cavernicola]BEI88562.1 hypothetical protein CcaverHIS019_0112800 [Cutaneotrichosporon cavernicola]BEI96335.1 hypothetical protein CcaverHIS631_0112840 [Cutaneotrichosporon cavernicola]BEJ04107.1 hypothetical protein CcaverHIS641_0112820 [Cutaneotrichosporon cavernicola]